MTDQTPQVNDTKVEVKRIPFRCPVCNGYGTLKHGQMECHGCKGKGFVVIDNEDKYDKQK